MGRYFGMKKIVILGIILSFLCGCGDKTITNEDYESTIKNIEYNNFKITISPTTSLSQFYFDLSGKKYDYTYELKESNFDTFIDNNSEDKISALIIAFNFYEGTQIMFNENGYTYRNNDFEYVVTNESEYASYSDQVGSCNYIVKNDKDNSLESTCNKTQESTVKAKIEDFKKKLKASNLTSRILCGLKNYIIENYLDSWVTETNESYLNSSKDISAIDNILKEKSNYLHTYEDDEAYYFFDSTYTNAFVYYYENNEVSARMFYNSNLTGDNGYLISINNGQTYHYSNTKNDSGCIVEIPFNTMTYKKTGNESSKCTDKDFSNIDSFLTEKNNFILSLSIEPSITENDFQKYVESKIK